MQKAAKFAIWVRARLRSTQQEFSTRIQAPLETIRNGGQDQRNPTDVAKAPLTWLDPMPKATMVALAPSHSYACT